jgi:hypothetical protein
MHARNGGVDHLNGSVMSSSERASMIRLQTPARRLSIPVTGPVITIELPGFMCGTAAFA